MYIRKKYMYTYTYLYYNQLYVQLNVHAVTRFRIKNYNIVKYYSFLGWVL